MATREDELKDLREKNNELVQKVQYWKMTAAQREDEKLALMKEINELRLKLSRLRSTGGVQARNFDTAIQATSERALAHLVRASGEIAHTIELAKTYMRDRQELDAASPRWSAISGSPSTEKTDRIHRVPPMMIGGQSIQPVVALSRTLFNTSNPRPASRSPNQNRSVTERAVPMHMLQDVYIPLTRIDAGDRQISNAEAETDAQDADNSAEDLGLEDSMERMDESQDATASEDFEASRRLDAVTEDIEPEDEVQTPPRRGSANEHAGHLMITAAHGHPQFHSLTFQFAYLPYSETSFNDNAPLLKFDKAKIDNPLEGPSWLLDSPEGAKSKNIKSRVNLEPDSTTEVDEAAVVLPLHNQSEHDAQGAAAACTSGGSFSPTVRRRKRTRSPLSPALARALLHSPLAMSARRNSNSGRVLKVLVAKMRLTSAEDSSESGASPPKRASAAPALSSSLSSPLSSPAHALARFDAPSPNGATDAALLVSEADNNNVSHLLDVSARESTAQYSRRDGRHERLERNPVNDRKRTGHSNDHERSEPPDRSEQVDRSERAARSEQGINGSSRAGSETSLASSDGGDSRDSDAEPLQSGRTRRSRKPITYKEKPLNRKLRR